MMKLGGYIFIYFFSVPISFTVTGLTYISCLPVDLSAERLIITIIDYAGPIENFVKRSSEYHQSLRGHLSDIIFHT